VVNPDLFASVRNGSPKGSTFFLEVDRDTLDKKALGIKVLRLFQYYASRKFKEDLETDRFPRICIIVPSSSRLAFIQNAIVNAKKHYSGAQAESVGRMPFWLATFDDVEVNSINQGFVSRKPLDPVWVNELGKAIPSPLLP